MSPDTEQYQSANDLFVYGFCHTEDFNDNYYENLFVLIWIHFMNLGTSCYFQLNVPK
jgi:hypothetical protein